MGSRGAFAKQILLDSGFLTLRSFLQVASSHHPYIHFILEFLLRKDVFFG